MQTDESSQSVQHEPEAEQTQNEKLKGSRRVDSRRHYASAYVAIRTRFLFSR